VHEVDRGGGGSSQVTKRCSCSPTLRNGYTHTRAARFGILSSTAWRYVREAV
jgi:hypothetical protein